MTSYLQIALHSPIVHHLRTMRKPSPKRNLLAIPAGLLVASVAKCEERPEGTDPVQNWPLNTCLPGSGVWPPNFYPRSTNSGLPPPLMQHFIPLFGERMTCYLPPWASIFWIMSLLTDSSYRHFPCTTAPLIHMIICYTLTRH